MSDHPKKFTMTRTFHAPRDILYEAWTESEHLHHWWAPREDAVEVKEQDLTRKGGDYQYKESDNQGRPVWGKFNYRELEGPEKLTYVHSYLNEKGKLTRGPYHDYWPMEVVNTVTFSEEDGVTTVHFKGEPIYVTEEEREAFEQSQDQLKQGFNGAFDQLEEYIESIKRRK
ncbi:SRPBCC family protein [Halobacillus mangrovi]|uniref:Activator of Hsp90 ATPase homologue 1/2-like C-terminal domain-containing protein n=1 Tax=Halobacillus mangrovi TaxID=402384 RepID=A0A1W5ZXH9_9BACI|nr:SRPBCC domain-containing protein [Halobacillus mangrovi]ARI77973.1 hypothetical protein HM131_14440 [Halobacillus mangrovi]